MLTVLTIRKRGFYIKLLISFVALSIIITMVMAAIFSTIAAESSYKQLTSEYLSTMKQGSSFIDNVVDGIGQIYTAMNVDLDIYEFLNSVEADPYVSIRAENKVRKMRQINPYIDSIVLYNRHIDHELLFIGNTRYENDIITEKDIVANPNIGGNKNLIPRKLFIANNSSNSFKPVISIIFNEYSTQNAQINNSIVINIDENMIIQEFPSDENSISLMVNQKGIIMAHPDADKISDNISKEAYFSEILLQNSDSGTFRTKFNNKATVVTYYKNNSLGCYLINVRSYNSIIGSINEKRNQIVTISIIVLFVCFVAVYIISKYLYSPIKKITEEMEEHTMSNHGYTLENSSNEFKYIMDSFKDSINQVEYLEKKNETSIPRLREDMLRKVLKSEVSAELDLNTLEEYRIGIEFENLFAIRIDMDSYVHDTEGITAIFKTDNDLLNTDKFGSLQEMQIHNIASDVLSNGFLYEIINMYDGGLALLLNFKNKKSNDFDTLLKSLKRLVSEIINNTAISVTIGIGGVANSIAECRKVYSKAVDMTKYRFVVGYGHVIYQQFIDDHFISSINYPEEIEEKLINSIRLNKKHEFAENMNDIEKMLSNYQYSDAVFIYMQISLLCIRTMKQITSNSGSKFQMDFEEFNKIFAKLQTIKQVKKWLMQLFDEYEDALEDINRLKGDKYFKIIDDIKQYIYDNYKNAALSTEMLADMVGYTPNYFAKIFREVTGINVFDFIRQVRINKAKELLKHSSMKIGDISDSVGFINTSYFYSSFKKEVGLTPSAFRCLITDEEC